MKSRGEVKRSDATVVQYLLELVRSLLPLTNLELTNLELANFVNRADVGMVQP